MRVQITSHNLILYVLCSQQVFLKIARNAKILLNYGKCVRMWSKSGIDYEAIQKQYLLWRNVYNVNFNYISKLKMIPNIEHNPNLINRVPKF